MEKLSCDFCAPEYFEDRLVFIYIVVYRILQYLKDLQQEGWSSATESNLGFLTAVFCA